MRVARIGERLGRHPAHRQRLRLELVVVARVLLLARTDQVDADLDGQVVAHQHVAGGQVAEDKVLRGQVLHAGGDLLADVEEVGHGALLLLLHVGVGGRGGRRARRADARGAACRQVGRAAAVGEMLLLLLLEKEGGRGGLRGGRASQQVFVQVAAVEVLEAHELSGERGREHELAVGVVGHAGGAGERVVVVAIVVIVAILVVGCVDADEVGDVLVAQGRVEADLVVELLLGEVRGGRLFGCARRWHDTGHVVVHIGRGSDLLVELELVGGEEALMRLGVVAECLDNDSGGGGCGGRARWEHFAEVDGSEATFAQLVHEAHIARREALHARRVVARVSWRWHRLIAHWWWRWWHGEVTLLLLLLLLLLVGKLRVVVVVVGHGWMLLLLLLLMMMLCAAGDR